MYVYRKTRRKVRRLIKFSFLFIVFGFIGVLGYNVWSYIASTLFITPQQIAAKSTLPSPATVDMKNLSPTPTSYLENNDGPLSQIVTTALDGSKGTYGIVIKNLKTGEKYYQNETKVFTAGSLYKLWVLGTVYKQLDAGTLKKTTVMKSDVVELTKRFGITTEYEVQKEGDVTYSIGQALNQMIVVSDNYASLLLTEKAKTTNIRNFMADNGFNSSSIGLKDEAPSTTPLDIASFFEKLYAKDLFGEETTNEMIDLLKQQRLNGKIPKYLPTGTQVAHKTGELYSASHDAGIVYAPEEEYLIVLLSDTTSQVQANERLAKVSEAVYAYFTKDDTPVIKVPIKTGTKTTTPTPVED